jgi:mannose-6-phosphate isomerase-like protein (cupin superfamily)
MVKMTSLMQLKNELHGKNIVELKPWKSIHKSITLPMITALGEKDIPGSRLAIGFAYVDKPDLLGVETHKHNQRDQWIFLFGAKNFAEFDADVEFVIDNKVEKINYPFYAYIPAGTWHMPLNVTRVGKPLIFIDARIAGDDDPPVFFDKKITGKGPMKPARKAPVKKSTNKKT